MFAGKAGAYPSRALALDLSANIRLGWKDLLGKTHSLFSPSVSYEEKSYVTSSIGENSQNS
jgi:hypothetical protein